MKKRARLDALLYSLLSCNPNCRNQVSSSYLLPSSRCGALMVVCECFGCIEQENCACVCSIGALMACWWFQG